MSQRVRGERREGSKERGMMKEKEADEERKGEEGERRGKG